MSDKEYENFIDKKFGYVGGVRKMYRVIVIENGCKKVVYDFETEKEATICYGLLYDNKTQNEEYLLNKEVFLTIYYAESV